MAGSRQGIEPYVTSALEPGMWKSELVLYIVGAISLAVTLGALAMLWFAAH